MSEEMSDVARTRILEYQRARRRFDQVSRRPGADRETVDGLREARRMRVKPDAGGDR